MLFKTKQTQQFIFKFCSTIFVLGVILPFKIYQDFNFWLKINDECGVELN